MWAGTGFILVGILILLIAIKYERQNSTSHGFILFWGVIFGLDFIIFGISYLVIGYSGEWIAKYWGFSIFVIFILTLFAIAAAASEW